MTVGQNELKVGSCVTRYYEKVTGRGVERRPVAHSDIEEVSAEEAERFLRTVRRVS